MVRADSENGRGARATRGCALQLPNTAGLFVGGLFLGLGLVAIGGGIYYFWNKRKTTYTGLA